MDKSPFKIGALIIEPARNTLRKGEKSFSLEPLVMDLLCALAEAPQGGVISRDELIEKVWKVEYGADERLTRAVSIIRNTIKSAGETETYIETIPKRGYRLAQAVSVLPSDDLTSEKPAAQAAQADLETAAQSGGAPKRAYSAVALGAVGLVLILSVLFWPRQAPVDARGDLALAVLPLQWQSDQPDFAPAEISLHDELIGAFLAVPDLKVVPQTSVMRYVNSDQASDEIARELNVDALIEARIEFVDERFEIDVRLIESFPSAQYTWTETYGGEVQDLPDVQSAIALGVGEHLGFAIDPEDRIEPLSKHADSAEAYSSYLLGKAQLRTFTPEGFQQGIQDMETALELSPGNLRYLEALALAHSDLGHVPLPPDMSFRVARDYAQQTRAQARIDGVDFVLGAELALAEVALYYDWDVPYAKSLFEAVLERHPHSARANIHYAWLLDAIGDTEGAERHMRISRQLSPYDPLYAAWYGWWMLSEERHKEAIVQAEIALEIMPGFPIGAYVKGAAAAGLGDFETAIATHQVLADQFPYAFSWPLGVTYALSGEDSAARQVALSCTDENDLHGWCRMVIYCALNDTEPALRGLESAITHRHSFLPWVGQNYACSELRDNAQFESLRSVVRME